MSRKRIVVLLSGNGSTLQALIDQESNLHYEIVGVFSNRPDAYGLIRAETANIPSQAYDHKLFPDRITFDQQLQTEIEALSPDFLVLAGYMRILSSVFVQHFEGRMINIHPSLLPKHKGTHTHQSALNAGDSEHGTTVHFVTEELDSGATILQASLTITPEDTVKTLEHRIKQMEKKIYPLALDWLCSGRMTCKDNSVTLDNKPLPKQGYLVQESNLDQICQNV